MIGLCVFIVCVQTVGVLVYFTTALAQHAFLRDNLQVARAYGSVTDESSCWAVVTGGSSGQGKEFALQLAERGFDIFLIGSVRSHQVADEVRSMGRRCEVAVKDFGQAFRDGFFDDVTLRLKKLDIAVLINSVGHRTAWNPYHECPVDTIRETIACGTMVQAHLTRILLPHLIDRTRRGDSVRSAVVFITAQCMHPNVGIAATGLCDNAISIPYLAAYEASNAFGFYHASSLIKEYAHIDRLDMLNVTPGAVITPNTSDALSNAPFQIDSDKFVRNVIRMLGGKVKNGTVCAHVGHSLSMLCLGVFPWIKQGILKRVGLSIAKKYMENHVCNDESVKYALTPLMTRSA